MTTPYQASFPGPVHSSYLEALRTAGRTEEALAVEQNLQKAQAQAAAIAAKDADAKFELVKKRAEIDPMGAIDAELHAANLHVLAGEKQAALVMYNDALSRYQKVPAVDADGAVDRKFWDFVQTWLSKAETKDDERIIYSFVDTEEEKIAQGANHNVYNVYQLRTYYSELHRRDAEIALLKHIIQKRRELRPNDTAAIEDVSMELSALYQQTGMKDESIAVNQAALETAEKEHSATDPQLIAPLVNLAEAQEQLGQSKPALKLIDRAAFIANLQEPGTGKVDFALLQKIAQFYATHDRLEDADRVLRSSYRLARSSSDTGAPSGVSLLNQAPRNLLAKYQHAEEYDKAESLMSVVLAADGPGRKIFWARDLSELYLGHAAQLKQSGNQAKSKKLLALSNEQFQIELHRMEDLQKNPAFSSPIFSPDSLRQRRSEELARYGFDAEEDSKTSK